jgi:hypothetical protein
MRAESEIVGAAFTKTHYLLSPEANNAMDITASPEQLTSDVATDHSCTTPHQMRRRQCRSKQSAVVNAGASKL